MKSRPALVLSIAAVLVLASAGGALGRAGSSRAQPGACGMPSATPVWIDYGEGSVRPDVRAVLARPGVVVASSGTAVPADFRSHGAATVYFVLHLPRIVGEPTAPADPATIQDAAAKLLAQAQASTGCGTPWIALNELAGPGQKAPWSPSVAQYRANLLAFVQALAAGGAHPALLVHGDPTVAGATADWWRQVAQSSDIVYEAYYDATRIYPMGAVMGNRRMRMGIRNVVALFESVAIPPERLGIMLGFHSARTPGIAGRQGLEPTEAWLRVVKWEALAARQVATEERLSSLWSWGWGTFGPESVDPDKAVAACSYLWARDPGLCDAPAMAGSGFEASRVEGQIVLPAKAACTFAGGRVWEPAVARLARLTGDRQSALTAQFARAALSGDAPVSSAQVLAAERAAIARSFHGSRQAYLRALARRDADAAVARGVIADELRRHALATRLGRSGSGLTPFEWTAGHESRLAETAICRGDVLPGSGDFPASDARDVGAVPLAALLPFLFGDRTAPGVPEQPVATLAAGRVSLAWTAGREADLAGYEVLRSLDGGPYAKLGAALASLSFVDRTLPAGATAAYALRAVDTSGNRSAPSPAAVVAPLPD